MRERLGILLGVGASLLFLGLLAWPYVPKSVADINTYYTWGLISPLIAGGLVLGVLVALAAASRGYVSADLGPESPWAWA